MGNKPSRAERKRARREAEARRPPQEPPSNPPQNPPSNSVPYSPLLQPPAPTPPPEEQPPISKPPEKFVLRRDAKQLFLSLAFGGVLFLVAPKLTADYRGYLVVILTSLICFVLLALAVWSMGAFRKWIRAIALFALAGVTALFAWWVWPEPLTVGPDVLIFHRGQSYEQYSVSVTNNSDKILYRPTIELRFDDRTYKADLGAQVLNMKDEFAIDLPPTERKSIDPNGPLKNSADVKGMLCEDTSGHPKYMLLIVSMQPKEMRQILVTRKISYDDVIVAVKKNNLSASPLPVRVIPGVNHDYYLDIPMVCFSGGPYHNCSKFVFYIDDPARKGMEWLQEEMSGPPIVDLPRQ